MSAIHFIRTGRVALPALAALAMLGGCGGSDADSFAEVEAASAGVPGESAAASAAVGTDRAPGFELPDLGGRTVRLADSDGRVRLIDFWATWCPPCRDEIPMLNELHHEYGEQGLTILAISEEKAEVVREFADEIGMDYTNLIDPGEVSLAYRVFGLPTAFLIDQEGRVVEQIMGPKTRKQLEGIIRELLDLPPTT